MRRTFMVLAALSLVLQGSFLWGQAKVYVYPNRGQSPEEIERDKFACHNWAIDESGIDPYDGNYPRAGGEIVKGAVVGAAVGAASGAAIGAITGDAGKGAAVGATAGGCAGSMRGAQRATRIKHDYRNDYHRAYAACMAGRGYTVR